MSANHCEEKLLEFAYGELSSAEANAVEVHLASCTRCSGALQSIRQVRKIMSRLPVAEPSSAGLDSLLSYAQQAARRAQAGSSRSSGWKKWLVPGAGVTALAVVAGVSTQVVMVARLSPSVNVNEPVQSQAREQTQALKNEAQNEIAEKHASGPGESTRVSESVLAKDAEPVPRRKLAKKAEPKAAAPQASLNAPSRELDSVENRTRAGGELKGVMGHAAPTAGGNFAAKVDRGDVVSQAATESASSSETEARQAKLAGNRTLEVEHLRQALAAGAQGAKRADLLFRLCDALDSIGNKMEAEKVCQQLILEFPASQEAKAAANKLPSSPPRAKPKNEEK